MTTLAVADAALAEVAQPGRFRRFVSRHPRGVDATIAIVYLVPYVVLAVFLDDPARFIEAVEPSPEIQLNSTGLPGAMAWFMLGAQVPVAVCLAWLRRSRPLVLACVALATGLFGFWWSGGLDPWPVVYAVYAVAVHRSARWAWGYVAVVSVASLAGTLVSGKATSAYWANAFTSFLMVAVVTAIASNIGSRRRYVSALVSRADQLARERDQLARLAVADERSRIAREMHDVVSHSLQVMITLSDGAAATVARSPEEAREVMSEVSETGRDALADMRRMLRVLRGEHGDDDTRAPQPGANDVMDLIERFQSAGLPVRFTESGRIPEDRGVQLTVYRVLQESLTNALRHASRPTRVDASVRVDADAGNVVVRVVDDGRATPKEADPAGQGLIGMRERVTVLGGALRAGRVDGRWTVEAAIPLAVDNGGL